MWCVSGTYRRRSAVRAVTPSAHAPAVPSIVTRAHVAAQTLPVVVGRVTWSPRRRARPTTRADRSSTATTPPPRCRPPRRRTATHRRISPRRWPSTSTCTSTSPSTQTAAPVRRPTAMPPPPPPWIVGHWRRTVARVGSSTLRSVRTGLFRVGPGTWLSAPRHQRSGSSVTGL